MNGIAALPGAGEFLLTGKNWRYIYHVRLTPSRPHPALTPPQTGSSVRNR
jgi:hypothetical protein